MAKRVVRYACDECGRLFDNDTEPRICAESDRRHAEYERLEARWRKIDDEHCLLTDEDLDAIWEIVQRRAGRPAKGGG